MFARNARTLGLVAALAAAATTPLLLANCAAPADEGDSSSNEDAVTGVDNPLGLRLTYDNASGQVNATLRAPLQAGQSLRIRVRRGATPTLESEKQLDCASLNEARPIGGNGSSEGLVGKVLYKGPVVDRGQLEVLSLYNDTRWQTDPAWSAQQLQAIVAAGGPKLLVEACVMQGTKVAAKLQTPFEYAWDQGAKDAAEIEAASKGRLHFADEGDGGTADPTPVDQSIHSMEEYAAKCVSELGEIPFFKKLADGKYDTYDCRDFVGTGAGHDPAALDGVEGSLIPLSQNDQPVTKCDGDGPNGTKDGDSYNCVDKCDHAEMLDDGCEPGPTVSHAKNAQGTHWVLLCRKVGDGETTGWTKTKKFNDIAMIGTNPKTGKTCFFQNQIGSGTDGEHIPHPADVEKSRTLWDGPEGYCFQSCHGTDPYIQSPWINGARRKDNTPMVPMMGFDPDFLISTLDSPYYVVNMDQQGWTIPKQLVDDAAAPCESCHRVGGDRWMEAFANWTSGGIVGGGPLSQGDEYWNKITDSYKSFAKSHFMPMRLDGVTEATWADSKWAKAVAHINACQKNNADPSCQWADVPRGRGNPPAPVQNPNNN